MFDLTNEILARYIGGQLEVQNETEGYIYRGEIKTAQLNGKNLKFELEWMAKGVGYPPIPTSWITDDNLIYEADLEIYSVFNIGPGSEGDDRVCLQSSMTGEVTVLFPPNGSKLDRSKIE